MTVPTLHPVLENVTARILARQPDLRAGYLAGIAEARARGPSRGRLSCANLAHVFAASPVADKLVQRGAEGVNIGIVSAYNDMLSAHQPFEHFPDLIRKAAREIGASAQMAGATPAMCDGVTQGQGGMELSLFSRDVIAMATAIAFSHDAFEAGLCLGVCDKIVPGLVIGALSFAHLPILMVPAGPMSSGLPNKEKARIRALYAEGKLGRDELLQAESQSYHGVGTCTFYGTANTNQLLMEAMGLHLPGAAFVHPDAPLRAALTRAATFRAVELARAKEAPNGLAEILGVKAFVNSIVALVATGGSTNLTLHLVAMARAAGFVVDWSDFDDLSAVTPLLCRIYPNGSADVNHFQAAGGPGFLIAELLRAGLMHPDVMTVSGHGLARQTQEPFLIDGRVEWRAPAGASLDTEVLRPVADPFDADGGIRLLTGNLGRAVIKTSAVAPAHRVVEAPAAIFHSQAEFTAAFKAGALNRDFVAVLRFQGPSANGMPELHQLSPPLSVLQDRGFKVALVSDGRMSGASGKTPAAIHLTPEAAHGGPLARVQAGDIIRLDAEKRTLDALVPVAEWNARPLARHSQPGHGLGRELFGFMRRVVGPAEEGGSVLFSPDHAPRAAAIPEHVA